MSRQGLDDSAVPTLPHHEPELEPEAELHPPAMLNSPDSPLPMPDTPGPPTPFSSHGAPSPASTYVGEPEGEPEADGVFDEELPEAEAPEGDKVWYYCACYVPYHNVAALIDKTVYFCSLSI